MVGIRVCLVLVSFSTLLAEGRPQEDKDATVIDFKNNEFDSSSGGYSYSYETSNGISREETGSVSGGNGDLEVQGSYTFTSPEGITYTVTYTSGVGGYKATIFTNEAPPAAAGFAFSTPVNRISGTVLGSLAGG